MIYQHHTPFIAAILSALLSFPAVAAKEPRIALLIGNSEYGKEIGALPNPVNDVRLISKTLRELEFEVLERTNADEKTMKRAIQEFGDRLGRAGTDAVGLFYYAGHGLQVNGVNYLVPANAHIEREGDVEMEAVNAGWVLDQMENARNRVNLMILDACRNNPVTRSFRSVVRGLASIDAPRGTLIAYSTAPGRVSIDGEGSNSPYTSSLAKYMKEPGIVIEEVFRKVRVEVLSATKEAQTPWESSSLTGAFYFHPPAGTPSQAVETETAQDHTQVEVAYWNSVKDSQNPQDLQAYLDRYPQGNFADIAHRKLKDLPGPSISEDVTRSFEITDADHFLFARKRAVARSLPMAEAGQVAILEPGKRVQVTGRVKDRDWYRVRLGDERTAYIWVPLLVEEPLALPPRPPVASPPAPPSTPTQPPLATAKAHEEPKAVAPKTGIAGRWQGQYRCQDEEVGFSLTITQQGAQDLAAVFEFFPLPGSLSFPRGKFGMVGQYDPVDGSLQLRATDWIERPLGFERHDLEGNVQKGGARIEGRISTTGCAEFVLTRR